MAGSLGPEAIASPTVRLDVLDGARGFAVLLVILDHASDSGFLIHPLLNFNRAGQIGVQLFFVLSAFLLSYLLLSREESELRSRELWLDYFLRRTLRIYPLFLVTLCFQEWVGKSFTSVDVLNHLVLRDGQRHFWTIPVEFKFYLVLPLIVLAIVLLRRADFRRGALAALAAGLTFWALVRFEKAYSLTEDIWFGKYAKLFLGGVAAGALYSWWVRRGFQLSTRWRLVFSGLALACLFAALVRIPAFHNAIFAPNPPITKLAEANSLFSLLWSVFIFSLLLAGRAVQSFFSFLPFRFLGWISFSAYLWHPYLREPFDNIIASPQACLLLYFVSVIAAASASYYLIEKPLLKVRFKRAKA